MSKLEAQKALNAGDLDACKAALFAAVRAKPEDAELRAFLFQYACVVGDWDRALKSLDALAALKPDAIDMVDDYRCAIAAEKTRAAVWAGKARPSIMGAPAAWIAQMAEAARLEAEGAAQAAHDMRAEALDAAPTAAGRCDETAFEWFADADTRLGPILEVVLNGEYHWMPFSDVAELTLEPPKDLRDVVWAVGLLTGVGADEPWPVMVPARYPGSEAGEAAIQLGRRTEWRELAGEHAAGLGQRLFATDGGDIAALDLRRLTFDHPAAAEGEAPAAVEGADGDDG